MIGSFLNHVKICLNVICLPSDKADYKLIVLYSMIALVQRVNRGKVNIDGRPYAQIGHGYVVLVGIFKEDSEKDILKLADKIAHLRIMADKAGKMNKSILETGGEILLVPQFTLCADTDGRRPSFTRAKNPKEAKKLFELLVKKIEEKNINVKTGKFGAYMEVTIVNDGPVTILFDSRSI